MALFTGAFGSDEITYTSRALSLLQGHWSPSTYIGSIRYGVNIPVALFMAVFGINEFSANLWYLLCSLAEIVVVLLFACTNWGLRAASHRIG